MDDIKAEVTWLNQVGIKCMSPVQTFAKTGKKLVYFYGPECILLE